MLDLAQLESLRLRPRPLPQWMVANVFLAAQFHVYPGVKIRFEGYEKVPDHPVIFAMNHTDYYTFFPFMGELIRREHRYMSAWVKGKNYDSPFVAKFMEATNNIPVPSRGYLITRDFVDTLGHHPSEEEYRTLRAHVEQGEPLGEVPAALLTTGRSLLGHPFDPSRESYADAMNALFGKMTRRFVELNAEAFDIGLDLLVFPQGSRSVRLSRGHVGISQVALHFQRTIVPVGANNVDLVYPGSSFMARSGDVTFRFGDPIPYAEMKEFHIREDFEPFSPAAEEKHRERFQGLADAVMDRIEGLVDERHRYNDGKQSDGLEGTARFV